jgi:hypothetical protein
VYNREKKYVRESVLSKLRSPIFKIPALSKNDKAQKTTSKDPPNKVTINKTYLDETIKALIQSFFGLMTEIESNEELFKSVERSIGTFQTTMKANKDTAPKEFTRIRFPKRGDREPVDIEDMEESLLSLLETLQFGTFDNIFEAWRCIRGEPILPYNFSRDDLYHELELFQFESEREILVWPETPNVIELQKHFEIPKKKLATMTSNNECFKITVNPNYVQHVIEPIVSNSTTTEGPPGSLPFVEILKFVDETKKWHHNIVDQYGKNMSEGNYLGTESFEFLIFSDWFLKDIGVVTKTGDSDETSNGEGDNNSEASSRVSDGK